MTIELFLTGLYPWLTGAIGGFLGAALLLPTKLGEALIKFRYDRNLEAFKADQSRDLESVKERLAHLGDRGKRSNELEFSATRAVWEQFMEAYAATDAAILGFVELPDLARYSEEERQVYLNNTDFSSLQKQQVLEAGNPTDMYSKVFLWRKIANAREAIFRAGPGCLDSAPLDLSGFLPGYAERGALRFCRCVGRA
ncbi:hypothetical protein, partial [Bradyrhizobium sp. Mp27]|uniref:hypothetical protein n=1 Tax=Bradyrhizobium sp. Mp27 TaxID=3042157 RepID=UPI00248CE9B8